MDLERESGKELTAESFRDEVRVTHSAGFEDEALAEEVRRPVEETLCPKKLALMNRHERRKELACMRNRNKLRSRVGYKSRSKKSR